MDLSYLDPSSGRALLHEAARRKDLRLIDLSVRAGADVFVRDLRGKSVGESSKDEKVKVFFKQCESPARLIFISCSPSISHKPRYESDRQRERGATHYARVSE